MDDGLSGTARAESQTLTLGLLEPRHLAAAAAGTAFVALAVGIPTDLVPNPWFTRMIPPGASNYFFWISTSVLSGALLATYALPRAAKADKAGGAGIGGGVLGLLAAGCPVCNKLVVLLLGVSGALSYFEPIQPLLGAAALIVATTALMVRLRGVRRGCAVPGSATQSAS
jgi:hypothetical protein